MAYRYQNGELKFQARKAHYTLIQNYIKNENGDIVGGIADKFVDLRECKEYAKHLQSQSKKCVIVKGTNLHATFFGIRKNILFETKNEMEDMK